MVIPPERISFQTVEQHADLLAPQMFHEAVETVQLISRTHPSTMFEVLVDVCSCHTSRTTILKWRRSFRQERIQERLDVETVDMPVPPFIKKSLQWSSSLRGCACRIARHNTLCTCPCHRSRKKSLRWSSSLSRSAFRLARSNELWTRQCLRSKLKSSSPQERISVRFVLVLFFVFVFPYFVVICHGICAAASTDLHCWKLFSSVWPPVPITIEADQSWPFHV